MVTGANSGIGFETARALAHQGARVTMACRNLPAAEQAAQRIRSSNKSIDVHVAELDLSSSFSVRRFADALGGPAGPAGQQCRSHDPAAMAGHTRRF
ncbi:MAG TPA: SDR family NAD(P)-dependent oxidoreductase [Dermatophilaceae bacterium]